MFRWVAIPWLQSELDIWAARYNSSPRRHDSRKVLPTGVPDIIASKPHLFGAKDFKVRVTLRHNARGVSVAQILVSR